MDLDDVIREASRLGPIAHLATVTAAGEPHVVPVHVDWLDGRLYCSAGTGDAKVRNLGVQPAACLHFQVAAATGWDSLMIWARGRILTSLEDKRRLWHGVFSYDLNEFDPGGPDNAPESCFLELEPTRAVLLRRYGLDGREAWRPG